MDSHSNNGNQAEGASIDVNSSQIDKDVKTAEQKETHEEEKEISEQESSTKSGESSVKDLKAAEKEVPKTTEEAVVAPPVENGVSEGNKVESLAVSEEQNGKQDTDTAKTQEDTQVATEEASKTGEKKPEDEKASDDGADKPPSATKTKKRKAPTSAPVIEDDEEQPISFSLYGRMRKSVDRMKTVETFSTEDLEIEQGTGMTLRDIEIVEANIKKQPKTSLVLRYLHQLAFGKVPKQATVKHNLLDFSGIIYPAGEEEFYRAKLVEKCSKMPVKNLKEMLDLLDVPRGKAVFGEKSIGKEDYIKILLDFMEKPSMKEKKASTPKSKKRPLTQSKKATPKAKKAKAQTPKEKSKKPKPKSQTKKKTKGTKPARISKNSTSKEASDIPVKKAKADPPKKYFSSDSEDENVPLSEKIKKRKAEEDDDSGFSSDSDTEVILTNDQIKKQMKDVLSSGDFEQLTLKRIRENLEEHFGVGLLDRKEELRVMLEECIQEMN